MVSDIWPKRLFALDVSRGIASLAVVFYHWQHFYFVDNLRPGGFDKASQPMGEVFKIFYVRGNLGVEYFFLLSGFIFFWLYKEKIEKRQVSFSSFWLLRLSRLYPLHLVTLFFVAFLQFLYVNINDAPFIYTSNDTYHFILNLAFASSWGLAEGASFNAPIWSVSIEILLYFIFFFVVVWGFGSVWFCLVLSAVFFLFSQYMNHKIYEGLSLFFLGGGVFYTTFLVSTMHKWLKKPIYLACIIAWLIAVFNIYFFDLHSFIYSFGIVGKLFYQAFRFPEYVLFPLTISSLVLIEVDKGVFLRAFSWIGDITYSLYLLHFPLQILFVLAMSYGFIGVGFYMKPVYLFVYFSLLIPLSYVVYLYFERSMQMVIRKRVVNK